MNASQLQVPELQSHDCGTAATIVTLRMGHKLLFSAWSELRTVIKRMVISPGLPICICVKRLVFH